MQEKQIIGLRSSSECVLGSRAEAHTRPAVLPQPEVPEVRLPNSRRRLAVGRQQVFAGKMWHHSACPAIQFKLMAVRGRCEGCS